MREKASYTSPLAHLSIPRRKSGSTHILFIIHLPRREGVGDDRREVGSSFTGFQRGRWLSAHIDDIRTPSETAIIIRDALTTSISKLFYEINSETKRQPQADQQEKVKVTSLVARVKKPNYQCSRLYNRIQAAVGQMVDSDKPKENLVEILLDLVPQQPEFPLSKYLCLACMCYCS